MNTLPLTGAGPSAVGGLSAYELKVLTYSPIAYWPLKEATGTDALCSVNAAQNGTYDGVTLGQTGIGDGYTCAQFDGDDDYVDIYSAALNTAYAQALFSISLWVKVFHVDNWTDETRRFMRLNIDVNNEANLYIAGSNIYFRLEANGTTTTINEAGLSETGWMHFVVTNNETTDNLYLYRGGTQKDTTTNAAVSAGNLSSSATLLGDKDKAGADPWKGYIAHVAVFDKELTQPNAAALATV